MAIYARFKTNGQYFVENNFGFSATPDIESATDLLIYGENADFIIDLLRSSDEIFEILEV